MSGQQIWRTFEISDDGVEMTASGGTVPDPGFTDLGLEDPFFDYDAPVVYHDSIKLAD
jgi:hypothetical protein